MIPFLDKTIVKLGLALAIITALGFGLKFIHNSIYQAGADSVYAELAKAYEGREAKLAADLELALADQKKAKVAAVKLQSNLNQAQAENRKLRDEINNADFICPTLGDNFMELWNKTIGESPKLD